MNEYPSVEAAPLFRLMTDVRVEEVRLCKLFKRHIEHHSIRGTNSLNASENMPTKVYSMTSLSNDVLHACRNALRGSYPGFPMASDNKAAISEYFVCSFPVNIACKQPADFDLFGLDSCNSYMMASFILQSRPYYRKRAS